MADEQSLTDVVEFLEGFAPTALAADWDNVGLLLGDRNATVSTVMTCLTVTPEVVAEAIETGVEMIVTHHPMPFRSLKKITTDTIVGRMILDLNRHRINVYSPHTAFDSTAGGINDLISERLGLGDVVPLKPFSADDPRVESGDLDPSRIGVGRRGNLPQSLSAGDFGRLLKDRFGIAAVKHCGNSDRIVSRIGIACGSAGEFLVDAQQAGCDAFVTGETSFHGCLEAIASGTELFLLGHYGSERFAVEILAEKLADRFVGLTVFASRRERDPVRYVV